MGDAENSYQPSKKRAAGVQLTRDNPDLDDNEESSEQEAGTFQRASDEVLATRRIVKVRRQQTSTTPAAPAPTPASNPFAAVRLVPAASSDPPVEAEACNDESEETEPTDDGKSETKFDEQKGESTAEEGKTDVNEDNTKQSESKIDEQKGESTAEGKTDVNDDNAKHSESKIYDSKTEPNALKDESNNAHKLDTTESVVEELTEGGDSDDGVKKTTEAGNSEAETRKDVEDEGNEKEKENGDATGEKKADTASFNSFQQLSSSQNAFSGLTGTGFSSTSFSFGSIHSDKPALGSGTDSLFGLKTDPPNFGFGASNNGSSSIFGTSGASVVGKSEGSKFPPMQEVPVETGEENENSVFCADSVLFEFIDGAWKERGKGEVKVNVSTAGTGKARLIMRARGNYRLILNASLFPDMKLTNMDKKGITFACVNSAAEGKEGLSTIALKFRDASTVEDFQAVVAEHKSLKPACLRTPENSPGADES